MAEIKNITVNDKNYNLSAPEVAAVLEMHESGMTAEEIAKTLDKESAVLNCIKATIVNNLFKGAEST